MEIREYLISVTAAAVLSSCVNVFFENAGSVSKLIKVLSGIFVSLAVISPLLELKINDIQPNIGAFSETAQSIVSDAEEDAAQQQRAVIKEQTEAYVCDKADALGCTVSVDIDLCDEPPYQPKKIRIKGKVSPYAKSQLSAMITSDLGIEPEEQQWSS